MRISRFLFGALAAAEIDVPVTVAAQELKVGLALEPSSIDPHYHNLTPNNALAREIFDRLVMTDEKQKLMPGLAVSWKAVDDLTCEDR